MNISITIDKKGFSGVKVVNVVDYLKRMAEIVKVDIQDHLENSQAITGGSLAPLSPKTVERKSKPHKIKYPGEAAISAVSVNKKQRAEILKKLGSLADRSEYSKMSGDGFTGKRYISKFPSKPLIDGGNLLRNQKIEKVSDSEYNITIGVQRNNPSDHQPAKRLNEVRPFFGISEQATGKIRSTVLKNVVVK